MSANNADPEKGFLISTTASSLMPTGTSSAHPGNTNHELGSLYHTPLELFQLLVGLHTPPSLTAPDPFATASTSTNDNSGKAIPQAKSRVRSDNKGLYHRAKQQERASRLAYIATSFISNTLYLLQILLAATFTGLSAYKDASPVTLTTLGAINTVLAGCLAWQKGQGVPLRYRKAQDQYQALLLEIEQAERSFLDHPHPSSSNPAADSQLTERMTPHEQQARLQKLFDEARADQQANYPDLYVSTSGAAATAAGGGSVAVKDKEAFEATNKELTKQLEEAKAETARVAGELLGRIEALVGRIEGGGKT